MRNRADSPTKTCTRAGCTKPLRARGLCSTHYNQAHQPDRHQLEPRPCEVCQEVVMRTPGDRYRTACSTRCRNLLTWGHPEGKHYQWDRDAMTRARHAGATDVHLVRRDGVGERDGWVCQICLRPTNRTADPLHPDAPTVDHIVPLSKGGQHTMSNVQLACYSCNSRKRDTMDEPLTCAIT